MERIATEKKQINKNTSIPERNIVYLKKIVGNLKDIMCKIEQTSRLKEYVTLLAFAFAYMDSRQRSIRENPSLISNRTSHLTSNSFQTIRSVTRVAF